MKEVILKATDGTEVVLTIDDHNEYSYPKITFIKCIPKETQFKVGQWCYDKQSGSIFRIAIIIDSLLIDDSMQSLKPINCRAATYIEIRDYLVAICRDRGLMRSGTICYDEMTDGLYINGEPVYLKGKWAEIVPDKKKLPRTKDELHKLLNDLIYGNKDSGRLWDHSIRDFLKEYED